jgi:hypothetical protein
MTSHAAPVFPQEAARSRQQLQAAKWYEVMMMVIKNAVTAKR